MDNFLDTELSEVVEITLRPNTLNNFIGQDHLKSNLLVFINSAQSRKTCLDHVLLYGPPGLGKTTLAQVIANELNVHFRSTSGPLLSKAADLAAILTNIQQGDVLFIDEIHRLPPAVEEVLYSVMEDFKLDLLIGEGPSARTVNIDIARFTLIGATTRIGLLTKPLRERFGIPLRLNYYEIENLQKILFQASEKLTMPINSDGAKEIALRSRGTPRVAIRLLKRVIDFAHYKKVNKITQELAKYALERLEIDKFGLDKNDYRYLNFIFTKFNGGPVGIDTIAAGLSEHRDSIEETIEPYLMQQGFIDRTTRGRMLTKIALDHLANLNI